MKIYHNPRCRKSRETLKIIQDNDIDHHIIEYLNNVPLKGELKNILKMLDMPAANLVRKTEVAYKEKYKGKDLTEDQWIDAMIENPKLIERPIVIKGNKAIIGRPPERVHELI